MTARSILKVVSVLFNDFWKRHQLTLGLIVYGLCVSKRAGIAAVARMMPVATTPKHAIKRVDRFIGNRKFDDVKAQQRHLRNVIGPRKRVLIAVDWTAVCRWKVLVAAVVQRGRAIPVLWSVMDDFRLYKSYNAFENGFFTLLKQSLPETTTAVLLLDRGFARADLARHLNRLGLRFIIRIGGNVYLNHSQYRGLAQNLVTRKGRQIIDLVGAKLRRSRCVEVRVVATWSCAQKQPWLLVTNLSCSATLVLSYYHKRFRIEESFRDQKSWRFGLALKGLNITKAHRLERMLLVVAVYYLLVMMVGSKARRLGLDRQYRANTVRSQPTHSDFTLGQFYILTRSFNPLDLLQEFYDERVPIFRG